VNVVNKKCEDCRLTIPNFGVPAEGKARWCSGCAKAHTGAVDIRHPKCESCGLKEARLGLPSEPKKRRWCGDCAQAARKAATKKPSKLGRILKKQVAPKEEQAGPEKEAAPKEKAVKKEAAPKTTLPWPRSSPRRT
jgi:hypothetical protein